MQVPVDLLWESLYKVFKSTFETQNQKFYKIEIKILTVIKN